MVLDQEILSWPNTLTGVLLPRVNLHGGSSRSSTGVRAGYVTAQSLEGVFIEGTSLEHSLNPWDVAGLATRVLMIWSRRIRPSSLA
jgi:hypothetical protein